MNIGLPENDNNIDSIGRNEELRTARAENYSLRCALYSLLFLSLSISANYLDQYSTFDLKYVSSILIGIFGSFLAASIIQKLQNTTIERTLKDILTDNMLSAITGQINKIRKAHHVLTPDFIYWSSEDLFDRHFEDNLLNSDKVSFMSTSARYLLNERMPKLSPRIKDGIELELLLLNPTNCNNISLRVKQMKDHNEIKTKQELQEEIICNIKHAFDLYKINEKIRCTIRFHNELPLFRIERPDNDSLYLSFYCSQRSRDDLGPVSKYCKNNDFFRTYTKYFEYVWNNDKNSETEIKISDFDSITDLLKRTTTIFPELSETIRKKFA